MAFQAMNAALSGPSTRTGQIEATAFFGSDIFTTVSASWLHGSPVPGTEINSPVIISSSAAGEVSRKLKPYMKTTAPTFQKGEDSACMRTTFEVADEFFQTIRPAWSRGWWNHGI